MSLLVTLASAVCPLMPSSPYLNSLDQVNAAAVVDQGLEIAAEEKNLNDCEDKGLAAPEGAEQEAAEADLATILDGLKVERIDTTAARNWCG